MSRFSLKTQLSIFLHFELNFLFVIRTYEISSEMKVAPPKIGTLMGLIKIGTLMGLVNVYDVNV